MNTYNNIKLQVIALAVLLILSASLKSQAQTDTSAAPVSLDGHRFIVNSNVGSPFTNTTFKNILGAGQTMNLEMPNVVIRGVTLNQIQGEVAYTTLGIGYQQEIRDWMAFYGEIALVGRLGTETGTLVSQGVNLITGYQMGWKFKVLQTKNFRLSTNLNIQKSSFTTIDLPAFIQGIIDSGKVTRGNKLVNYTPLLRGGIGVHGAYAFNKTFGAIAKFYVDYGESAKRYEDEVFNYTWGITFDADLYPVQKVPLGFLIGFRHSSLPTYKEEINRDPNEVLFQINFTGKKYLSIGAEIVYQWYRPEKFEQDVKFVTITLNSSIYF